jgi:superfamily II DNA helicase RecQ
MLLALPEPPEDSRERVAAMLADHRAGQHGRIAEMMAYADSSHCRHGHIGAYFGGRSIDQCQACDNCLGQESGRPRFIRRTQSMEARELPAEATALILQAVAQLPHPLGRTGLARTLTGAATAPAWAQRSSLFGALAGWTQKRAKQAILQLTQAGLLAQFQKGRFPLLRLTSAGRTSLGTHAQEGESPSSPEPAEGTAQTSASAQRPRRQLTDVPGDYDPGLFEQLRTWQLGVAAKIDRPPYVVLHIAVLKRIAARKPITLSELAEIKGIGPRKLEQYGHSILDIVTSGPPDRVGGD